MRRNGEWFGDTWVPAGDAVLDSEAPSPHPPRQPDVSVSEWDHYRFLHEVGVCAATGQSGAPIEVEHLRGDCYQMNKADAGMSMKPHWIWTIPLQAHLHQERHRVGASGFFRELNWPLEDLAGGPLPTALALFGFSALGDVEGARRWLRHRHMERFARTTG